MLKLFLLVLPQSLYGSDGGRSASPPLHWQPTVSNPALEITAGRAINNDSMFKHWLADGQCVSPWYLLSNSEGKDGFQTFIFISNLQVCNTATITKEVHHLLLKVGLHLSSVSQNGIFTSLDFIVKSPRDLLLLQRAREPNL